MKIVRLLILLLILVCAASAWAQGEARPQEYNTIFFRANDSYQKERYDAAIQDYEQLVNAGLRSTNIYYNLGNAYIRTGNKGRAVLYYERAFRMRPRDADVRANLGFVRKLVEGSARQNSGRWYMSVLLFLRGFLSVNEMAFLAFILYLASMSLVSLGILFRAQRRLLYYSAAVCGCVLLLVLPSLIGGVHESEFQERAVIMAEEVAVRFNPDDGGTVHFSLYEGAVIQITRSQGEWSQVRRGDGKTGWLRSAAFVVI
jgi:hypothetical protein